MKKFVILLAALIGATTILTGCAAMNEGRSYTGEYVPPADSTSTGPLPVQHSTFTG